jgi:hypothetical protein
VTDVNNDVVTNIESGRLPRIVHDPVSTASGFRLRVLVQCFSSVLLLLLSTIQYNTSSM